MNALRSVAPGADEFSVDVVGKERSFTVNSARPIITLGESAFTALLAVNSERSIFSDNYLVSPALAFALAHELGHWLVWDPYEDTTPDERRHEYQLRGQTDRYDIEARADRFAWHATHTARISPEPAALVAAADLIDQDRGVPGISQTEQCLLSLELRLRASTIAEAALTHGVPFTTTADRQQKARELNDVLGRRRALASRLQHCQKASAEPALAVSSTPASTPWSESERVARSDWAPRFAHINSAINAAWHTPAARPDDTRFDAVPTRWRDDAAGLLSVGGGAWLPIKHHVDSNVGAIVKGRFGFPLLTRLGAIVQQGDNEPPVAMFVLSGGYAHTRVATESADQVGNAQLNSVQFGVGLFFRYPEASKYFIGIGTDMGALRDIYSPQLASLSRWSPYLQIGPELGARLAKRTHLTIEPAFTFAFDGFIKADRGDFFVLLKLDHFVW